MRALPAKATGRGPRTCCSQIISPPDKKFRLKMIPLLSGQYDRFRVQSFSMPAMWQHIPPTVELPLDPKLGPLHILGREYSKSRPSAEVRRTGERTGAIRTSWGSISSNLSRQIFYFVHKTGSRSLRLTGPLSTHVGVTRRGASKRLKFKGRMTAIACAFLQ